MADTAEQTTTTAAPVPAAAAGTTANPTPVEVDNEASVSLPRAQGPEGYNKLRAQVLIQVDRRQERQ
jgi:hypothetical protein